jgi:hypothetical protein
MRNARVAGIAAAGIATAAIAACSGAILPIVDGGGGGNDASMDGGTGGDALPSADAGAPDATVEDATVGDATVEDATVEACADRWCNCLSGTKPALCDDFDKPNEKLGEGWSGSDSGFYLDDGATIALTDAASSLPNAMGVQVPTDPSSIEAAFSEDLAWLDKWVVVAFDLRVSNTVNNCKTGHPELVRVASDYIRVTRKPIMSAALGFAGGTPTLYLQVPAYSTPVSVPLGSIPSGQWMRVRLSVHGLVLGGSVAMLAWAYVVDAGVPDSVDAQAAGSGAVWLPGTVPSFSWASVGLLDDSEGGTGACDIAIDNVAIYQ